MQNSADAQARRKPLHDRHGGYLSTPASQGVANRCSPGFRNNFPKRASLFSTMYTIEQFRDMLRT
jgi:hypothetical protein